MLDGRITTQTFVSSLIDYMFILVFCLLGAIVKDAYNTLTDKETKVKIPRILISTLVSSIILFSLSDYILTKMKWKTFIIPCFIGGGLGFDIFGKINKIEFWINVLGKNSSNAIIKTISNELDKDNNIDEVKNKDPTEQDEEDVN